MDWSNWLSRCRKVTEINSKYDKENNTSDQLLKVYEEVFELQSAPDVLNTIEEGSDVIYSVLTYFHMLGIDDYAIMEGLESTLRKIERRATKLERTRGMNT